MARYVDDFRVEYVWKGKAICSYFTSIEKAEYFMGKYSEKNPKAHMVIKKSVIEWKSII